MNLFIFHMELNNFLMTNVFYALLLTFRRGLLIITNDLPGRQTSKTDRLGLGKTSQDINLKVCGLISARPI